MILYSTAVTAACLLLISRSRSHPDIILMGGLTLLIAGGAVSVERAVAGFSNTGVLTLAALYVVVAGLRETGAIAGLTGAVLGFRVGELRARLRMMTLVAASSAFVNNTPLVAVTTPMIREWAERRGFAASRLLMPLSFAAIAGGTCTLLGSSVNLALAGLLDSVTDGSVRLSLWSPALLGLPVTLLVLLYCQLLAGRLLPGQQARSDKSAGAGRYYVEFLIEPNGPLHNRSIADAGLRHLQGVYLAELMRGEQVIAAVGPDQILQAGDRLVFVGDSGRIGDLMAMRGLLPAEDQVFKLDAPRHRRLLAEAVVGNRSELVGQSIRQARLRTRMHAVVVSVFRDGAELPAGKIGDIVLRAGDMLLLEAPPEAIEALSQRSEFLMVQARESGVTPDHGRRGIALAIFAAMIATASFGTLQLLTVAWLGAGAMLLAGCVSGKTARSAIDWEILVVLAAAIGIGNALIDSGAVAGLTGLLTLAAPQPGWVVWLCLFAVTALLSAVVTNGAAVVIMFPVALSLATANGLDLELTTLVLLMAASASFMTPIAYQTNLIVYSAGGYRFVDFLRMGTPLTVLCGLLTVALASVYAS